MIYCLSHRARRNDDAHFPSFTPFLGPKTRTIFVTLLSNYRNLDLLITYSYLWRAERERAVLLGGPPIFSSRPRDPLSVFSPPYSRRASRNLWRSREKHNFEISQSDAEMMLSSFRAEFVQQQKCKTIFMLQTAMQTTCAKKTKLIGVCDEERRTKLATFMMSNVKNNCFRGWPESVGRSSRSNRLVICTISQRALLATVAAVMHQQSCWQMQSESSDLRKQAMLSCKDLFLRRRNFYFRFERWPRETLSLECIFIASEKDEASWRRHIEFLRSIAQKAKENNCTSTDET